MRLLDLNPHFLGMPYKVAGSSWLPEVSSLAVAAGVRFLCPVCFVTNKGAIGTHSMICWSPVVPQTEEPRPGRWRLEGTGYHDLSLVAGSSSVLLRGACQAHFFVEQGAIRMC